MRDDYIQRRRVVTHLADILFTVAPREGEMEYEKQAYIYKGVDTALKAVEEYPAADVLTRAEAAQIIKDAARKAYADAQGSIFGQHKARGMMEAAKLFEEADNG